jgi:glyoxylase-like metal-dependent hydrolase (beta-lactamase superfamily II)
MNDWFTVEKIDYDTYVISEYRHWEETHCYLLIGAEKALLIDTGLGVSNIKTVIDEITELPLEIVTTHVHWDHIGGHKFFKNIAVYENEKEWLFKFPIPLHVVRNIVIFPLNLILLSIRFFKVNQSVYYMMVIYLIWEKERFRSYILQGILLVIFAFTN